jgi:Transglycosylase SLT domain
LRPPPQALGKGLDAVPKGRFRHLCAGFITHAGAPSGSPPLPVPRSAPQADYPRHGAQAEARIPDLDQDQTLEAKEPDGRTAYRTLIKNEAMKNGLPPDIADAVTAIESGYDPGAIGGAGEIGLMQVRPETAAMLGFNGDLAELARPDVNIHYGVTYLGQAWRHKYVRRVRLGEGVAHVGRPSGVRYRGVRYIARLTSH